MNINVWITKKCNLQCKYCYEGISKETESMSRATCDKVVRYVQELDEEVNVRFHGGEPLLEYENLRYLYDNLKKTEKIKTFGVTTNGTLLNKERVEFLCLAMDDLSISIDGNQEIHDKNRIDMFGKGSYKVASQWVPQILRLKPLTRVRMTIVPENVAEMYDSVEYLISIGFKVIAMAVDVFDESWSEQNKQEYLKAVCLLNDKYKKNAEIHISAIEQDGIRRLAPCGGGKNSIHIAPNGDFYPCGFAVGMQEFVIGNFEIGVKPEKLLEIERASQIINKECDGCTMYDFCPGARCKIINKIICGDYGKPPAATCMDLNVRTAVLF